MEKRHNSNSIRHFLGAARASQHPKRTQCKSARLSSSGRSQGKSPVPVKERGCETSLMRAYISGEQFSAECGVGYQRIAPPSRSAGIFSGGGGGGAVFGDGKGRRVPSSALGGGHPSESARSHSPTIQPGAMLRCGPAGHKPVFT
jgi:hypothetical protein